MYLRTLAQASILLSAVRLRRGVRVVARAALNVTIEQASDAETRVFELPSGIASKTEFFSAPACASEIVSFVLRRHSATLALVKHVTERSTL